MSLMSLLKGHRSTQQPFLSGQLLLLLGADLPAIGFVQDLLVEALAQPRELL